MPEEKSRVRCANPMLELIETEETPDNYYFQSKQAQEAEEIEEPIAESPKPWWKKYYERNESFFSLVTSLSFIPAGIFSLIEWFERLREVASDGSILELIFFFFILGNLIVLYQFITNFLIAFVLLFVVSFLPYLIYRHFTARN